MYLLFGGITVVLLAYLGGKHLGIIWFILGHIFYFILP